MKHSPYYTPPSTGASPTAQTQSIITKQAPKLLGRKDDAFVLFAPDHLEGVVEVLLARLDRGRVLLVARQVGVDELDEAVEVLGCYLL